MNPFSSFYHNKFRIFALLSLSLFFSFPRISAQEKFSIVHYNVDDGLSHTHVTSVLEHSGGFIWIGSKDGLDRFDGYEFHKIDLPQHPMITYGSEGPFIYSMKELEDGKIFMNFVQHDANFNIVYLFDPETHKSETIEDYHDDLLTFKTCYNQENNSSNDGFVILARDCHGNTIVKELNSSSIYLNYYDGSKAELSDDLISEKFQIGFMGLDFSKIIYAKATNGILKITPSTDPFDKYLNEEINDWDFGRRARAICPANNSEILVSIEDENLKKVNLITNKIEDLVFRDVNNDTIIPTFYLTGIIKESDSIYYATALEYSFLRLNLKTLKAKYILQNGKFISYLQHHSIRLKNGKILIAGGHEKAFIIFQYDPSNGNIDTFLIDHPIIESTVHRCFLLEGKNGSIWIGTDYGLVHLDFADKEILSYYSKTKKSNSEKQTTAQEYPILHGKGVISLYEDQGGLLWIGLDKGGLDILDPSTNTIKNYNVESGLAGNTIAGIIEEKGRFWVSTYTGLSVIDTLNKNITTFRKKDGLAHPEFNRLSGAKTPDANIIMGGMNGIISFDPEKVVNDKEKITIQLSEVEYYKPDGRTLVNKIWPLHDHMNISIPADNKACAFKFFLSDFTVPESSIYEYKLVNKSSFANQGSGNWNSNDTRNEIRFNHLESGDYILYVRGKTNKGLISNTYTLGLQVNEYFYESSWFIMLVMALISILFYLFYRMKLNQIKNIENVREKLSSDLHDNVGSLLSGVAYQMELLEYSVDEEQIGLVQKVASSSRKAMIQMRNIVWALDSRNSNYQNLADRFREHAEEILGPLNIVFSMKVDNELVNKEIDSKKKHELLSIFQEFLTNTLKHSEASEVKVHIGTHAKNVYFSLKDNGKGIVNSKGYSTGQGLKNMELRAKNINGTINFNEQSGFQVEIVFPQKG